MKQVFAILFFFTGSGMHVQKPGDSLNSTSKKYYYLALGDSYTIGEMLPSPENFPQQVCQLLKNVQVDFQIPRIIARTGWTTDELEAGIIAAEKDEPLRSEYDFVSLLIGVNNQYRGRSVENYRLEFEELLKKAIRYADNKAERVVVLSIPDWGVTPFASRQGRDREQIAREIDNYNAVNREIATRYNVHYINITPWTREAASDPGLLAADELHPSAREYKRWAEKIAELIRSELQIK